MITRGCCRAAESVSPRSGRPRTLAVDRQATDPLGGSHEAQHQDRRRCGRGRCRGCRRSRDRRGRRFRRRAEEAALAETGGGRVTGTEVGDEESYYEVEVTLPDGRQVDVQLDQDFTVVGSESDQEDSDEGAG